MPITPDFKMFLKLMNLTTSSFDGEALNAIRMANSVLNSMNQTWEDLLHQKIVMIAPPVDSAATPRKASSGIRYSDDVEINAYFDRLYSRNLGTFKDWVDSVHEWWEEKGFLTEAQYKTLKKSALR